MANEPSYYCLTSKVKQPLRGEKKSISVLRVFLFWCITVMAVNPQLKIYFPAYEGREWDVLSEEPETSTNLPDSY